MAAASKTAKDNFLNGVKVTILFLDEGNTSYDAVWHAQEMMCDGTLKGERVEGLASYGTIIFFGVRNGVFVGFCRPNSKVSPASEGRGLDGRTPT